MPTSPNPPENHAADGASEGVGLYDYDSIVSVAGGDRIIVRNLIEGLIQSNRNDLVELDAVLEAEDLAGLAEVAHRFKGSARVINSQPLLRICTELEEAARTAKVSVAKEKAVSLRALILRMEEALLEQNQRLSGQ
ncbi:Hpt domain-containing protein [Pseudomonas aeruginosa]